MTFIKRMFATSCRRRRLLVDWRVRTSTDVSLQFRRQQPAAAAHVHVIEMRLLESDSAAAVAGRNKVSYWTRLLWRMSSQSFASATGNFA